MNHRSYAAYLLWAWPILAARIEDSGDRSCQGMRIQHGPSYSPEETWAKWADLTRFLRYLQHSHPRLMRFAVDYFWRGWTQWQISVLRGTYQQMVSRKIHKILSLAENFLGESV